MENNSKNIFLLLAEESPLLHRKSAPLRKYINKLCHSIRKNGWEALSSEVIESLSKQIVKYGSTFDEKEEGLEKLHSWCVVQKCMTQLQNAWKKLPGTAPQEIQSLISVINNQPFMKAIPSGYVGEMLSQHYRKYIDAHRTLLDANMDVFFHAVDLKMDGPGHWGGVYKGNLFKLKSNLINYEKNQRKDGFNIRSQAHTLRGLLYFVETPFAPFNFFNPVVAYTIIDEPDLLDCLSFLYLGIFRFDYIKLQANPQTRQTSLGTSMPPYAKAFQRLLGLKDYVMPEYMDDYEQILIDIFDIADVKEAMKPQNESQKKHGFNNKLCNIIVGMMSRTQCGKRLSREGLFTKEPTAIGKALYGGKKASYITEWYDHFGSSKGDFSQDLCKAIDNVLLKHGLSYKYKQEAFLY